MSSRLPAALFAVLLCLARPAAVAAGPGPADQREATTVVILVFDTDSLSPGSLQRAKAAAEAFVRDRLPEGTAAGVVAGGQLAGSRITSSRGDLLKALGAIRASPNAGSRQGDVPLDRAGERAAEIAATLDAGNRSVAEAEARSRRALVTLHALTGTLSSVPGTKTIVWVSDTFSAPAREREKVGGHEAQVQAIVAAASGASARIVGLDARAASARLSRDDLWQALIVGTGGVLMGEEKDLAAAFAKAAGTAEARAPGLKTRATPGETAPTTAQPGVPPSAAGVTPAAVPATSASGAGAGVPEVAREAPLEGSLPRVVKATPTPSGAPRLSPDAAARDASLRETLSGSAAMPEALLEQARAGWTAYQVGDTKTARSTLASAALHPAAPPWVHYVLGWAEFAEGNIDAARGEWTRVRSAVPEFQRVYFDLADCSLQQRKPADALSVLEDARKRWPASAEVLNAIGSVQAMQGRLDDALRSFESAAEKEPNDSSSHYNLARTLELRYFRDTQAARTRAAADSSELDKAAAEYRRVVELKGPEAADAAQGLRRTAAIDATKLSPGEPQLVGSFNDSALGGLPVHLAWSPDGTYLCIGSLHADTRGKITARPVRIVTVWSGGLEAVSDLPDWAQQYWTWKADLTAPWLPGVKIQREIRRSYSMYQFGAPTNAEMLTFRVGTEIVGEAPVNAVTFGPGSTFSWSPYAMGALAFVDRRGVLVIMDRQGRKVQVKGTRGGIALPAWSPDGVSVAYLEKSGKGYDLKIVEVYPK